MPTTDKAQIINTLLEISNLKKDNLGFVPTMGALHQGHVELVRHSVKRGLDTLCSIYVNPTQFNEKSDFTNYPIKTEEDIELLEEARCKYIYFPKQEELYPQKVESKSFDYGLITSVMEGSYRPGHFDGMATIVSRFFQVIQPKYAFFGLKDYQQFRIVSKLAEESFPGLTIIGVETIREVDGLAMSSRNLLIDPNLRNNANVLYRCLTEAKDLVGQKEPTEIENTMALKINQTPGFELEYFEIRNENTFEKTQEDQDVPSARAFVAARLGNVRLIDNLKL